MVDIKNDPHNLDEEYHFDDFDQLDIPDVVDATAGPTTAQASNATSDPFKAGDSNFGLQSNHRKIIIVGVVLTIILGLLIYRFVNHSLNSSLEIPRADISSKAAKPAVAPPAMQPQEPTKPVAMQDNPAMPSPLPPAPLATSVSNAQIDQLNATIDEQKQTISNLQSSVGTLQDTVNNMNSSITDLSGKVGVLMDRLPKPKPVKSSVVSKPEPPPIIYTVRAMVPGRAWLQASNGATLTVGVGNEVPGHGTVQEIDINAGLVTMGDGTIIGYNTN